MESPPLIQPLGVVEAIFRYPVKSMAGERLEESRLGWHGLEGDRRLAFRKLLDRTGFPWLTAGKLPELLRYTPFWAAGDPRAGAPTHVRTPDGRELDPFGAELAAEVEARLGAPVQMMELRQGIFDEGAVSVIAVETMLEIERLAGTVPDVRRFRPNLVLRLSEPGAFREDAWVGGALRFGEHEDGPCIAVTQRDVRCAMLSLEPDTARPQPEVLKTVVRLNGNNAGIYGSVLRCGQLVVGQSVRFEASTGGASH